MNPRFIVPAAPKSTAGPPTGPEWLHEIKFDGWLLFSDAFEDQVKLLAAAERFGLEGIVSKRKAAPYVSGERCGWLKIKTRAWLDANRDRLRAFA